MNNRKSNNILVIGVAVFAVGAALAFFGLRSSDRAVATPRKQPAAAATPAGNVRTVNVGPAGVAGVTQFSVPKGKQAVAVELPAVAGLAGYAKPGDTVNIYATIKEGAHQSNTKLKTPLAKLVLTNVHVLDVRAPAPGAAGTATYLLALDPIEAEKVIFYAKFESMWMALVEAQKPVTTPGRGYQNLL